MSSKSRRRLLSSTAIRSDYDLMSGLYHALAAAEWAEFGLLVSGAHLSPTFGYTVRDVRQDELPILAEIETLLDADSPVARIKSGSLLLQGALHTVQAFAPDILLVAGDREDALMMATIGAYLRIPTVHFYGGDHVVDGNVDNPVRHAISKLATVHFVSHESHRQRLLRLGEPTERIFVIGSSALDRFRTEPRLPREEVLRAIGMPAPVSQRGFAVVIHHPLLGEQAAAAGELQLILKVLQEERMPAVINVPNADAGARAILAAYESFRRHPDFVFVRDLPRRLFVNLLRQAAFLIGNSSLGLLEAPSVPLAAINVGKRQRGRLAAENVLFAEPAASALMTAIRTACSTEFQERLGQVRNPYGDGHSVDRAMRLLQELDLKSLVSKRDDPLEQELVPT